MPWRITPATEAARIRKAVRDCPTPILSPEECIRKALEEHPDAVVSWSGGRCSTAVLHMALQINPDVRVIFNDTGIEFPETYAFIEQLPEKWGFDLQTLKPKTTFWQCVKQYGFPMIRGKYQPDPRLHGKDGRPMCCHLLKEEPLLRAKITCSITGLRACESRMRTFAIAHRGQHYFAKTLSRWQWHPIALWSTEELLQYHKLHEIPQNEIYAMGHERCGCWPCTGYITWQEHLAKSHPKMYRALAKMKGEPTMWEYIEDEVELICDKEAVERPSRRDSRTPPS